MVHAQDVSTTFRAQVVLWGHFDVVTAAPFVEASEAAFEGASVAAFVGASVVAFVGASETVVAVVC
jgi:arginine utilization protein RocB